MVVAVGYNKKTALRGGQAEPHGVGPVGFEVDDRELVSRVLTAMESLDRDARGRALLLDVNLNGFVAARDEEWDGVRSLQLDAVPLY